MLSRNVEIAAFQSCLAGEPHFETGAPSSTSHVYDEVVQEWGDFHSLPDDQKEVDMAGMLVLLKDIAMSGGVSSYEAHNFCVNAEFDARFRTL